MTGFALGVAMLERSEAHAQARDEALATTRIVRTDLDRLFQVSRSVVVGLSYGKSERDICDSLGVWGRSFPEFFNLAIVEVPGGSDNGEAICGKFMPAISRFPLSADEVRLARGTRLRGDIIVAPIRADLIDRRPVIAVAGLRETHPDGTRRFAVATIDLDWLNRQVNLIHLPDQSVLVVLDRNGVIAAHNPFSREYSPGRRAPQFEQTLLARGDFEHEISGEGGVSRYYVLSQVAAADGLTVILKVRSSEIFRQAGLHLAFILTGLLVVSSLVFGLAWENSSRYMLRPLARLAGVADRLAEGHLSERTQLGYAGEIGGLARSLDEMAEALERQRARAGQMLESLRALTARLDSVADEERAHLAREIHDELGQQLTAMKFELACLRGTTDNEAAADKAEDLMALVDEAILQIRRIATELRPAALEQGGLTGAIRRLIRDFEHRSGIPCAAHLPDRFEVTDDVATCLFRICQESLTNVRRHAEASRAEVRLWMNGGLAVLTIRDNGRGMSSEGSERFGTLGILGMRERARIAGGALEVGSRRGEGTVVEASIPVGPQNRARTAEPSPEKLGADVEVILIP
jgi:signal transduction histidine kinase